MKHRKGNVIPLDQPNVELAELTARTVGVLEAHSEVLERMSNELLTAAHQLRVSLQEDRFRGETGQ